MPRVISHDALTAMLAQATSEVFIELLTIDHPDLDFPLTFCNNGEAIESHGVRYEPAPFKATLPADAEDREPKATVTVSNVDRTVVQAVRALSGRPTFTIAVVAASTPEVYEFAPYKFEVIEVRGDAQNLEFDMVYAEFAQEQFPALAFTPAAFRALHKRTT